MPWTQRAVAICLHLACFGAATSAAQGVAGAAIQGAIRAEDSTVVQDATVLVTNTATGERWRTSSGASGRFFVEHLSIGGPYRIEVRAVGFTPADQYSIHLSLGERRTVGVVLRHAVVELTPVEVRAEADPLINPARTGPAQTVSDSTIRRLPVPRDYTQLALRSPQVDFGPSGLSFAGQPDRANGLQVDGSTNNDLFSPTITIAGFPDLTIPTPESIEEVQLASAPFDVRYGSFSGGLVNAVTKSGSNRLTGAVYGYFQNQALTSRDTSGHRAAEFTDGEGGASVGGPIVRDRLAFFVTAGLRHEDTPQPVPTRGADTTGGADSAGVGIRYATLIRFRDILRRYGVDPGDFESRRNRLPSGSALGKITAQLGVNSRLEISHDYFHADQRLEGTHSQGFIGFSSNAFSIPLTVNATRLNWTRAFRGLWTNELLLARVHEWNGCEPDVEFPGVDVRADAGTLTAGSFGCGGLKTTETIWELTDNLGFQTGAHRLTLGMHHELIHLLNLFRTPDEGHWFFDSLDSLEQGTPSGYLRLVPGPLAPHGPVADFPVRQIGFYLQDQWAPTGRLTLTVGLRLDVPFVGSDPPQNPGLLAGTLGINTAVTPSGHPLWSPRLGASYDLSGRGRTFLRGGIGIFAGRPAYLLFQQSHFNTGLQQLQLACTGSDTPAFTLDPARQPTECAEIGEAVPLIAYFDRRFRFPGSLKIALGADQRLPWGMIGTADLLYARGLSQFAERDVNLFPPAGVASGEGGRPLYGTIDPATGQSEPHRRDPAFGPVIEMFNRSGDRSWSAAFQLQKRFVQGTELDAAYTYTDARDRQSLPADQAYENLAASPLDGSWEQPNLRTSIYSRPHKVTLTGTFDLPLRFELGLDYMGFSGDALTYVVQGDANADGVDNLNGRRNDNDPIYVPKDAGDITLADPGEYLRLDSIIREQSCLSRQRGRLVQRNSCRQPWIGFLNARLTKVLPTARGHSLQLSVDLFNVLHLLDSDWGLIRGTSSNSVANSFGRVGLLELVGYDAEHARGVYRVFLPRFREVDPEGSRWRLRLSTRYTF